MSDRDTSTIEEALDTSDTTKEGLVEIDISNPNTCLNCGFRLTNISACKSLCQNCGMEIGCSENMVAGTNVVEN